MNLGTQKKYIFCLLEIVYKYLVNDLNYNFGSETLKIIYEGVNSKTSNQKKDDKSSKLQLLHGYFSEIFYQKHCRKI